MPARCRPGDRRGASRRWTDPDGHPQIDGWRRFHRADHPV